MHWIRCRVAAASVVVTSVYCPENFDCSINCLKDQSCQLADFVQAATGTFKLNCSGDESCELAR